MFLRLPVTFSKYSPQQPPLEYSYNISFTQSDTKYKKKIKSRICEF